MRRLGRLAPVVAAAVLALRAAPAGAEPLDVSLAKLGPSDPAVWLAIGATADPAVATQLSRDAKQRFAILSNDVALAMSSALLEPGSTTGASGFDVAAEGSYSSVHGSAVGAPPPAGFTNRPWATISAVPGSLATSGLRVRKAFPFSFEMGGRLTYLAQTSYFAAQGEAKWALNEGFDAFPDVAVRAAYTRLFGARDWNLDATELGVLVSKRWGVSGVTSFTPYAAARFTFVNASSDRIAFAPAGPGATPAQLDQVAAAFPTIRTTVYRTTVGVRMTANLFSLALEGTYFAGTTAKGKPDPGAGEYPDVQLGSSFSAALRLGWEF